MIIGDKLKYKGASVTPTDAPDLCTTKFNDMRGVLREKPKTKKLSLGHKALNKNEKNRYPLMCGLK